MRAVVQRVLSACVSLPSGERRAIGAGLLVYLGVGKGDSEDDARKLAEKIPVLRIFKNDEGKFDLSVLDLKGSALVISQFTLYGDTKSGRRPDFTGAAAPELARPLYERFAALLSEQGVPVQTGEFGAAMRIESVNDGPVTLILSS